MTLADSSAKSLATDRETAFRVSACKHPAVERVYASRQIANPSGELARLDVYIPRDEGDYIYSLVRHCKPQLTVEIGLANGLSALFITAALEELNEGRHIAIDPFQSREWNNRGVHLIHQARLAHRLEVVEDYAHVALTRLEKDGKRIQFAFVDGSHLFDYVMADFLFLDRLLDVGGYLAFDDSDWPSIRSVLRFAVTNRHYRVEFPEIVIEAPPGRASRSGMVLRSLGRRWKTLGQKLRADFCQTDAELGLQGRCVVLRKIGHDDRNSQSRFHREF